MRCRPGDLALTIRACHPENIGKIVLVVEPAQRCFGEQVWFVEGNGPGVLAFDSALWPLRDPGDDAKDELLRPLPQEVTA